MAFVCDIPAVPTTQTDDDAVRITRWDFAPGAVTGWHSHGWPYFVIMLTPGILRVHNGTAHDVMNGSDHPIAFVEIEVKRPDRLVMLPEG
ncbi:MAG: cupin [Hyphomicrobiales bacterium]|nr:cupin [Hyphomicrobiales bacterium]